MKSIAEIFGQRVRYLRKQQGLSQESLSELCELHPTYIGQIERGEKNASLETVMRVSRGLGVTPAVLFENVCTDDKPTTAQRIYELVIEMSPEEQNAVLDIIKSIRSIIN